MMQGRSPAAPSSSPLEHFGAGSITPSCALIKVAWTISHADVSLITRAAPMAVWG
jgi:hypothetical protein